MKLRMAREKSLKAKDINFMRTNETIKQATVRKCEDCRSDVGKWHHPECKWLCRENSSWKSRGEVSEGDSDNVKIEMYAYENQEGSRRFWR